MWARRGVDTVAPVFPREGPAPPAPDQPAGAAADAIRAAETALARQNSVTAAVDLQVVTAVLNAHAAHAAGESSLRALQQQIEAAVSTRTDLDTPAGAREFQRYLIDKLHDIRAVVEEADLDDTSKATLAAALASLYATSGSSETSTGGAIPAVTAPPLTQPRVEDAGPPGRGPEVTTPAGPVGLGLDTGLDAGLSDGLGDGVGGGLDDGLNSGFGDPVASPAPAAAGAPPGAMPSFGGAPAIPSLGGLSPLAPLSNLAGLAAQRAGGDPDGPDPEPDPELDPAGDEAGDPAEDPPPGPADRPDPADRPELAAVIAAAVAGTPIADAFAQQDIAIPAPGSSVSAPLDTGELVAGDVGIFTDRHALALGNGKALLDNQIQPIETVNRPGFIGWQHPPAPPSTASDTDTAQPPAPLPPAPPVAPAD